MIVVYFTNKAFRKATMSHLTRKTRSTCQLHSASPSVANSTNSTNNTPSHHNVFATLGINRQSNKQTNNITVADMSSNDLNSGRLNIKIVPLKSGPSVSNNGDGTRANKPHRKQHKSHNNNNKYSKHHHSHSRKRMKFYSYQYSKSQIRLLNVSIASLLLFVIVVLIIIVEDIYSVYGIGVGDSDSDSDHDHDTTIFDSRICRILFLFGVFMFHLILMEWIIFYLKQTFYRLTKRCIAILKSFLSLYFITTFIVTVCIIVGHIYTKYNNLFESLSYQISEFLQFAIIFLDCAICLITINKCKQIATDIKSTTMKNEMLTTKKSKATNRNSNSFCNANHNQIAADVSRSSFVKVATIAQTETAETGNKNKLMTNKVNEQACTHQIVPQCDDVSTVDGKKMSLSVSIACANVNSRADDHDEISMARDSNSSKRLRLTQNVENMANKDNRKQKVTRCSKEIATATDVDSLNCNWQHNYKNENISETTNKNKYQLKHAPSTVNININISADFESDFKEQEKQIEYKHKRKQKHKCQRKDKRKHSGIRRRISNSKKESGDVVGTKSKKVLLDNLIAVVIVTCFLTISGLIRSCGTILIYDNKLSLSFIGLYCTIYTIIIVLIAPFSQKMYHACCFIVHRRCIKCFV